MATSTNLPGTEIYEVQESWDGRKDLWATYQVGKNNGPDGHPLTQGPMMVEWPNLLLTVWEGRSKWGDCSKPFAD